MPFKRFTVNTLSLLNVLFGLFLLCSLWGGLYLKIQNERQLEIESAKKETANYARAFEEHTIRTLRGLDDIAVALKLRAERRNGAEIDIPAMVKEGRFADQPFVQLAAANEHGILVASHITPFNRASISDLEHFRFHREKTTGQVFIGKPLLDRISGQWTVHLTRRINKADGSFGGVAVVGVNPGYFADFYKQVNLGDDSVVAIVGRDGFLRARQVGNDKEMGLGNDVRQSALIEKVSAADVGSYVTQSAVDGKTRILAYRALKEYPLVILVGVSEEHVFSDLNRRIAEYYAVSAAASGVILFFVIAILFGVARRQKAEEALRSSIVRYRALMEQSFEALALVDLETQEIVEVNRRFTELFGYTLPADAPLFAWHGTTGERFDLDKRYEQYRNMAVLPLALRVYKHKNGTLVQTERAGTIIDIDGKRYLLATLRDITEERRRQEELAKDINLAKQVQQELLPEIQESPNIAIRTFYYPSNFVSGDSYYLSWRENGTLLRGFLIDISGHGMATALRTASISALMREVAATKMSLMRQMQWINVRAKKYFTDESYAAVLGFELDLSKKELRYVGAGITRFYANGKEIAVPGMFVGLWDNPEFYVGTLSVETGDIFCFLTDGFTDVLDQCENTQVFEAGTDFDSHVAFFEKLAESGRIKDDATGICLRVK